VDSGLPAYWVPSTYYVCTKIFDSNSIFDEFWISNICIHILFSNSNQTLSLLPTIKSRGLLEGGVIFTLSKDTLVPRGE
jgi:hypothetical protein